MRAFHIQNNPISNMKRRIVHHFSIISAQPSFLIRNSNTPNRRRNFIHHFLFIGAQTLVLTDHAFFIKHYSSRIVYHVSFGIRRSTSRVHPSSFVYDQSPFILLQCPAPKSYIIHQTISKLGRVRLDEN